MNIDYKRHCGILMHVTSLPSRYGIGDLGDGAYDFIDAIHASGVDLWQILPLGPTGYGNSPYSPRSSFASNELLISPDELIKDGYLTKDDVKDTPPFREDRTEFDKVRAYKMPLLRKAAINFLREGKEEDDFKSFLDAERYWIYDYAIFMILYEKYQDARWMLWEKGERNRETAVMERIKEESADEIKIYLAMQYLFHKQWNAIRRYAALKHISIIGDIPIFVGRDSADTWSHPELFKRDECGNFNKVSGVPPDSFSPTGQLWGNPVYDWQKHEETDFKWWKERIRRTLETVDILRIDHFRGFDAYFEIDAKEKTAERGIWVKSPGDKLFNALEKEFGKLNIIAEDLGFITESVEKLRMKYGFPGMKIVQDGFGETADGLLNSRDTFLPHNYTRHFVAYPGTHDNNTIKGWFSSLNDRMKNHVLEYLDCTENDICWTLIRALMMSNADYTVFSTQDLLCLECDARMNIPSTCNDINWSWRMRKGEFTTEIRERLKKLNRLSARGLF